MQHLWMMAAAALVACGGEQLQGSASSTNAASALAVANAAGARCQPPQAAIDACQGKATGAACQVTDPRGGTHDGSCNTLPDGGSTVACLPARPPHPLGPPPEATAACASHAAGDACSFQIGERAIAGVCKTPPDASAPACVPERAPGPPPEATAACASHAAGDACSFSLGGHDLAGTCRAGPDGNSALACAPPCMMIGH